MTTPSAPTGSSLATPRVVAALVIAATVSLGGAVLAGSLRLQHPDLRVLHIFPHQFALFELPGGLVGLALIAIALVSARHLDDALIDRGIAFASRHYLAVACATVVALAACSLLAYHNHPVSMDEYIAVFQAKVFASGHVVGRFRPELIDWLVHPVFQGSFFDVSKSSGRLVPTHWPGFSLILTPFAAAGVPWLANPLLGGAALLLVYQLALRLHGSREAATWALLLTLASPAFLVNAFSYYSMNAHFVANLMFALLLLEPTAGRLVAAGAVGGFALSLNQPLPHFLFALPWLFHFAWHPRRVRNLALLAAGYLPPTVLLVLGWVRLRSAIRLEGAAEAAMSTPLQELIRIAGSFLTLPNLAVVELRLAWYLKLALWAVPGLLVLACFGYRLCRDRPRARLIAISAMLTLAGYWFTGPANTQGHGWGFRYFHSAWWCLPLFAVALVLGEDRDSRDFRRVFAVLALGSLVVSVPVHVVQVERFVARHLAQRLPTIGATRQIHILRTDVGYYSLDLVQNDPGLTGNVIRMLSNGRQQDRRMLLRNFPMAQPAFRSTAGEVWLLPELVGDDARAPQGMDQ